MRLILLLILFGKVVDVYASEKLVADFESKNREHITIFQKEREYGLDLIITKHNVEPGKKRKSGGFLMFSALY
jgi:hypothetical protein